MANVGRRAMLLAAGMFLATCGRCMAQEGAIPPDHHPWGRFPIGSWKTVRVISETLDDQGRVANVSITETKTTLTALDAASYTLRVETTVQVAGKHFASQPQSVKHGYHGETAGQAVTLRKTGDGELAIDGKTIPCELRQAVIEAEGIKRISVTHYSSEVPPYQLRRETTTEGGPEEQRVSTLTEVISLGLPQRVIDEVRLAAYVKTTRKQTTGSKVTMEVYCEDVPGGVVAHAARETDAAGRTIRRSTLELLDYAIGGYPPNTEPAVRRRFHRRAARRAD
ncbi:MAG: hypothetical protein SFU86_06100 [Pirellulaceae bacterium]|nr:hypothetical protein [Pirellulaceae bacterium]